jgi:hypothetical protein
VPSLYRTAITAPGALPVVTATIRGPRFGDFRLVPGLALFSGGLGLWSVMMDTPFLPVG